MDQAGQKKRWRFLFFNFVGLCAYQICRLFYYTIVRIYKFFIFLSKLKLIGTPTNQINYRPKTIKLYNKGWKWNSHLHDKKNIFRYIYRYLQLCLTTAKYTTEFCFISQTFTPTFINRIEHQPSECTRVLLWVWQFIH